MTTVQVMCFDEYQYHISITGHAEYAEKGTPDIVCSACSCLGCTLKNAIRKMRHDGELLRYEDHTEPGILTMDFDVRNREVYLAKAEDIVITIFDGFRMLEQKYPENVKTLFTRKAYD